MSKFFKVLLIIIGIVGVFIAVGFILNATVPAINIFFNNIGNWFSSLFKVASEIKRLI